MMAALGARRRPGRAIVCGGKRLDRPGLLRRADASSRRHGRLAIIVRGDLRPDPLRDRVSTTSTRRSRSRTTCAQGLSSAHLHLQPARGRAVPRRRRAATAASPTSTSAPRAPRSAAPSAARRTPAAAARPAPTAWKAYMRRQTCTINWGTRPAAGAGGGVQGRVRGGTEGEGEHGQPRTSTDEPGTSTAASLCVPARPCLVRALPYPTTANPPGTTSTTTGSPARTSRSGSPPPYIVMARSSVISARVVRTTRTAGCPTCLPL